jgi:hypothetical protein
MNSLIVTPLADYIIKVIFIGGADNAIIADGTTHYFPAANTVENLYLGFLTGLPTNANGTGYTEIDSATYTSYTRIQTSQGVGNWTLAGDGTATNATTLVSPKVTGTTWPSFQYLGIFDALTDGNLLIAGYSSDASGNPSTIVPDNNRRIEFSSGEILFSLVDLP